MDDKPSSAFSRTVKCPHCGKEAVFSAENPFRPFCSERCRTQDLGQWAREDYRIPSQEKASLQDLPEADSDHENDEES